MASTSCSAEMKFIDVTAVSDATVAVSTAQSVGNLSLFSNDTESAQKEYGTLELNQFILDGRKTVMPAAPKDIAFWSEEKSNSDCTFATVPTFTAVFKEKHSCAGITLYFVDDYPTEVQLSYYTLDGTKLAAETFYPDSLIYVCWLQVENFGKISIKFIKTRMPERYVKLQYVLYGVMLNWSGEKLKSVKVQEELDVTLNTLSTNTADIDILDENYDFDIANKNGAWKSVQKTQEVNLTETVDGVSIPMGTFFINEKCFENNIASFSLIDRIGLMDGYMFRNGRVYENEKAGVILEEIFEAAGVQKYEIEDEVYNTVLSGYLSIQSCRAALQRICFAVSGVADDSRSDTVRVYKPDRYVSSIVGTDRKFNGQTKIALSEYVSGVSIEINKYTLSFSTAELYNDVLPAGTSVIEFDNPCLPSSLEISGGTILEAKENYIKVSMPQSDKCMISGRKYEVNKFNYQKSVKEIEAGETENVKKFTNITLYNMDILPYKAQDLLDYYTLRKKLEMKYLIKNERVGNWVNINDVGGNVSTTLVESQNIDLTGGYIATASCVGYSEVITDYYYTGEIYSGDGGIAQ